jgi:hypothetical protein
MDRVVAYQVDAKDRITFVSPDWVAFAAQNGAEDLTAAHVVGRSLWGFMSGREVQRIYELVFQRVRATGQEIVIPLRCDAPGVRRHCELTVALLADDELDLEGRVLREEPRSPMPLLDPDVRRGSRWLTICSWCKRVRVDVKLWVDLEHAMVRSGIMGGATHPHLTHGCCPDCDAQLKALAAGEPLP